MFSVSTIPLTWILGRRLAGVLPDLRARELFALLASAFAALNALSIQYAQEFRSYSLEALLICIATILMVDWYTLRINTRLRSLRWIAVAIVASFVSYAHMVGGLFVALQWAMLMALAAHRGRRDLLIEGMACAALTGILISPLALTVIAQGSEQIAWVDPTSLGGIAATGARLLGITNVHGSPAPIVELIVASIPAIIGARWVSQGRKSADTFLALLVAPAIASVVLTIGISAAITPLWHTRYLQFLFVPLSFVWALGAVVMADAARRL